MRSQLRRKCFSVIGSPKYRVLRNLLTPEKPADKTFDQLVAMLEQHFSPVPSEIVETFKLYSHSRKPGESVAHFITQLIYLALVGS